MSVEILYIDEFELIDFVNGLKYGSSAVKYENENTRKMMRDAIAILNVLNDGNIIEEQPYIFDELIEEQGKESYFQKKELPDVFRILFKTRFQFEKITEGDLSIINMAEIAKNEECKMILKFNPILSKFAEKTAKNIGVKFLTLSDCWAFDGTPKKKSVFKKIQEAHISGDNKIEFDTAEHSINTIRCYASNLSRATGEKITCSLEKNKVVIYFKTRTPQELLKEKLTTIFYAACNEINPDEVSEIFSHAAGTIIVESVKNNWSENIGMLKDEKLTVAKIENDNNFDAEENTTSFDAAEDDDF